MKIHYELAQEFIWSDEEMEGYKKVLETKGENRRWSRTNTIVITDGTKFFAFNYEEALTEMSDVERFYPDPDGNIEAKEVFPVVKTTITYE